MPAYLRNDVASTIRAALKLGLSAVMKTGSKVIQAGGYVFDQPMKSCHLIDQPMKIRT